MEMILEETPATKQAEPVAAFRPQASAATPKAAPSAGGIRPEVLERVLAFIDTRFHEPLHVEDLGRHACLSPFHFARMFKISVGHAPHAYITLKRMERARELLAESDLAIADIARKVGFRTQAHFSGVFRKQVGTTPGQYRKAHRDTAAKPARPVPEGADVRL